MDGCVDGVAEIPSDDRGAWLSQLPRTSAKGLPGRFSTVGTSQRSKPADSSEEDECVMDETVRVCRPHDADVEMISSPSGAWILDDSLQRRPSQQPQRLADAGVSASRHSVSCDRTPCRQSVSGPLGPAKRLSRRSSLLQANPVTPVCQRKAASADRSWIDAYPGSLDPSMLFGRRVHGRIHRSLSGGRRQSAARALGGLSPCICPSLGEPIKPRNTAPSVPPSLGGSSLKQRPPRASAGKGDLAARNIVCCRGGRFQRDTLAFASSCRGSSGGSMKLELCTDAQMSARSDEESSRWPSTSSCVTAAPRGAVLAASALYPTTPSNSMSPRTSAVRNSPMKVESMSRPRRGRARLISAEICFSSSESRSPSPRRSTKW